MRRSDKTLCPTRQNNFSGNTNALRLDTFVTSRDTIILSKKSEHRNKNVHLWNNWSDKFKDYYEWREKSKLNESFLSIYSNFWTLSPPPGHFSFLQILPQTLINCGQHWKGLRKRCSLHMYVNIKKKKKSYLSQSWDVSLSDFPEPASWLQLSDSGSVTVPCVITESNQITAPGKRLLLHHPGTGEKVLFSHWDFPHMSCISVAQFFIWKQSFHISSHFFSIFFPTEMCFEKILRTSKTTLSCAIIQLLHSIFRRLI